MWIAAAPVQCNSSLPTYRPFDGLREAIHRLLRTVSVLEETIMASKGPKVCGKNLKYLEDASMRSRVRSINSRAEPHQSLPKGPPPVELHSKPENIHTVYISPEFIFAVILYFSYLALIYLLVVRTVIAKMPRQFFVGGNFKMYISSQIHPQRPLTTRALMANSPNG